MLEKSGIARYNFLRENIIDTTPLSNKFYEKNKNFTEINHLAHIKNALYNI